MPQMVPTQSSRCTVLRRIARNSCYEWPAYTETPLYDHNSLGGLEEDARVVATVWFEQDSHDLLEDFVCHWPLAYVNFDSHDRYTGHTRYGMEPLFRAFLLKELHGWAHKTALVESFEQRSTCSPGRR